MSEDRLDLDRLQDEARAGRLTHIVTVLSVLLTQARGPRQPRDEARLADALRVHWGGAPTRVGPLSFGIIAEPGREKALDALSRDVCIALVGRDVPGLVTILRVPVDARPVEAHVVLAPAPVEVTAEVGGLSAAGSSAAPAEYDHDVVDLDDYVSLAAPADPLEADPAVDQEHAGQAEFNFEADVAFEDSVTVELDSLSAADGDDLAPAPRHAAPVLEPIPVGVFDLESMRSLLMGYGAVLARMGAQSEALDTALSAMREGASRQITVSAPDVDIDVRALAGELAEALSAMRAPAELDKLNPFEPEQASLRRLMVAFGAILRRLSAKTDELEGALGAVRQGAASETDLGGEIDRLREAVAALQELASRPPPEPQVISQTITLDARADFQRVLVGHRAVLRELSASAEAARTAAETLAVAAARPIEIPVAAPGPATEAPGVGGAEVSMALSRLEGVAQSLHGLAEQMADRQEVAASAFFEAEKVGLHRIMVGFRATLRALTDQTKQAAPDSSAAAPEILEALARIEEKIANAPQIETPAPQIVTLDARSDFQRIIVGHRTVLRELSAGADAVRAAAERLSAFEPSAPGQGAAPNTDDGGAPGADVEYGRLADAIARLEAVADRAERPGPSPEMFAPEKDSVRRIVAGLTAVTRRLGQSADALDAAAARAGETAGEDIAARTAERIAAAVAEAIAQAELRRATREAGVATVALGPPRSGGPDDTLSALAALTRRVEAIQTEFAEASARIEAAARERDAHEGSALAEDLARAVDAGARDARALFQEFLAVAAALSKGWDNADGAEHTQTTATRRRPLLADVRGRTTR